MSNTWVIKSREGPAYATGELMVKHFFDENVIALEHNKINQPFNEITQDKWRKRGVGGHNLGYFVRFYNEMKPGDLVIVADGRKDIWALAKIPLESKARFDEKSDWWRHKRDVNYIEKFKEPAKFDKQIFGMHIVEWVYKNKLEKVIIPHLVKTKNIDISKIREYLETKSFESNFGYLHQILLQKSQMIFYGPPGTGKTFMARKFASDFIKNQLKEGG